MKDGLEMWVFKQIMQELCSIQVYINEINEQMWFEYLYQKKQQLGANQNK
tara:strand:- start:339 stop:488 length:150 start_codon:yes stop_codon:yes gene_type:complete